MFMNMTTEDGQLKICESGRSMGVIGFVTGFMADIKSVMFLSESILDKSCDNEPGSKPGRTY